MWPQLSTLLDPFAWRISRRELRPLLGRTSIPAIIAATDEYQGRGQYRHISALHNREETSRLAGIVQLHRPNTIVEIGTCWGGTLFVWARSNPQVKLIVSMDLPGGEFGGGYVAAREKLYREFVSDRPGVQLELLRVNSHLESTLDRVRYLLNGRPIDFLFIDGDHTFDGVKRDFEMYSTLVAPGGLIAFHDIQTQGHGHQVMSYWKSIRANLHSEEIVDDPLSGEYGIGLIRTPQQLPLSAADPRGVPCVVNAHSAF